MDEWIIANGLTRREFVRASLMGTATLAFSSAGFPTVVSAQAQGPSNCRLFRTRRCLTRSSRPVRSVSTTEASSGVRRQPERLVKNTPYEKMSLEEVVKLRLRPRSAAVFNNAAQVWNHTFYWNGMKPGGGGKPTVRSAGGSKRISGLRNFRRNSSARPGQFAAAGRGSRRTASP